MEPFLSTKVALIVLGLLKEKAVDKGLDAVLKALFQGGSSEQQLAQQRIERKVQAIARGPMDAGLFWLEHAAQPGRASADIRRSLELAAVKFIDGYGQLDGVEKARAVLLAAFTFHLLDDLVETARCLQMVRAILDEGVQATLTAAANRRVRTLKFLPPFFEAFDESQWVLPALNEMIGPEAVAWTAIKTSRVFADGEAGILKNDYFLHVYRNGEKRGEIDISKPFEGYLDGLPGWVYALPISEGST